MISEVYEYISKCIKMGNKIVTLLKKSNMTEDERRSNIAELRKLLNNTTDFLNLSKNML